MSFARMLVLLVLLLFCAQVHVSSADTAQEQTKIAPRGAAEVELFTTSWCPYCKKAVAFLKQEGIPFKVYDVERDRAAYERFAKLNPSGGVPVALINGHKIKGFSEEAYRRALAEPSGS